MHITHFLTFGIIFLSLLCLFAIGERTHFLQRGNKHYNLLNTKESVGLWIRGVYLLLFAVMASVAVSMMNTYLYPTDEKVFRNVDYHVLSHKGYEVGEKFYLANGCTSESEGNPIVSLWDSKEGLVLLDRADSCFVIKEYIDPLYVRKDTHRAWWQFWEDTVVSRTYHLVNKIISEDISRGFVLTHDNDTLYTLQIEPIKGKKCLYISTVYNDDHTCISDTSTFKNVIYQGYPLLDIIAKSPRIELSEDLESWFEGAYLARAEIPMDGNTPTFDLKNPAPLCLMPGLSFYLNGNMKINGVSYAFNRTFIVPFSDYANGGKVTFFSGLGKKKTEEYRLSYLSDNRMRLEFLKPDMKQIKDTLGRVFISSSIDDISRESLVGGYMYNKFEYEDNYNHINAHFQYRAGDARSELSIHVVNLDSIEELSYKCDEEFLLHSRGQNPISWIFEVTDLRETNDLSSQGILIFILVMFVMIAVRVLSDSFFERYTLSLTELAIYIILFSLSVVRLILGWRASTFVPVEDISLPMYLRMRTSILDGCIWMVACLPLGVAFLVEVWNRFNKIKNYRLPQKVQKYLLEPWTCLLLFVLLLMGCGVAREISLLGRLCNIPLPIIFYFSFEIWMNILMEKDVQRAKIRLCRTLAFVLLFGYLFIADAGFTIIFLAYMIVHYLVLGSLYWGQRDRNWRQYRKYRYVLSITSVVILFLILYFEGEIMMFLFRHVGLLMTIISALLLMVVVYLLIKHKQWLNKWVRTVIYVVCTAFFVVCFLDAAHILPSITSLLNSKAHMRYRAEIQRLSGNETIDDLILECEFDSDDIMFIMRSAHNQWFINQYIRAGQKMEENNEYFHLQPHSNQGATYPTQTTDLVVTRYLLAEHGEGVVKCILFLWLMLILLFVLEFKIKDRINRVFLNGPILIYVISLLVYLSATNRIVFVGQDFPLISLQSKVAVIFPLFLLSLLLGRSLYLRSRETSKNDGDSVENIRNGIVFVIILPLFTWGCVSGIEQKGKEQEETQFNVSRLIADLSAKVDDINERFEAFQEMNSERIEGKNIKEVWAMFSEGESSVNRVYREYLNPDTPDFFSSLLHYFRDKQKSKTDANQLLHLRRRSGTCYLALNKQHYFIPAIMGEEALWSGDIYAAKVDPEMMLLERGKKVIKVDKNKDYERNVLFPAVQRQIPDMPLMRFDEGWVPGDNPLFLISSKQGQSHSMFFNLEADSLEVKDDGGSNQIATSVMLGDQLILYKREMGKKSARAVFSGHMTDNTPYIVRNMWINGHKRLFFPLGKQLMWSYHLGNLVSDVYSKELGLRDTSLYLSLDYDLCKTLYANIKDQIRKTVVLSNTSASIIEDFSKRSFEQQCNPSNNFYYDKYKKEMVVRAGGNRNLRNAAKIVNRELRKYRSSENPLSKALGAILKTQYDFTAVAIDGDGHIRAMFDYSRNRHLDPNNVTHLNRVISELYQDGSNADERDIFGSKALHYIPVGPGSSFKPIAYTSITSQEKLNWESIDVSDVGRIEAQATDREISESGSIPYAYYGGVSLNRDEEFNIQGGAVTHDLYLVRSNNLYHSVIMLLGMQSQGGVERIMRPYTADIEKKEAFPVFTYNGKSMCFNPKVWYENKIPLIEEHDLLTEGLYRNFRIKESAPRLSSSYTYLFGRGELIRKLYDNGNSTRGWVFPETSSLNNADRNQSPLRVGFNQIVLGADPLQQTPLQMAVNASRLASLNRSENMVSILDGPVDREYEFFDIGSSDGWTEQTYLDFMKRQVWTQLRKIPKIGTASSLRGLASAMENGKYGVPYYLYCKTGTLNKNNKSDKGRMRHLMVIITDRPLEEVNSVSELKQVRYYTLYLSYLGINDSSFSNYKFQPYIEAVLNSSSFNNYMNRDKNDEKKK